MFIFIGIVLVGVTWVRVIDWSVVYYDGICIDLILCPRFFLIRCVPSFNCLNVVCLCALIEHNVTRNDDAPFCRVVESVGFAFGRVSYEQTFDSLRMELGSVLCWDVCIRLVPERPQVSDSWLYACPCFFGSLIV